MANFQTHIGASTVLGVGYGAVAHFYFDVSIAHSLVAAALCSIAGMLPDRLWPSFRMFLFGLWGDLCSENLPSTEECGTVFRQLLPQDW